MMAVSSHESLNHQSLVSWTYFQIDHHQINNRLIYFDAKLIISLIIFIIASIF